MDSFIGLDLSLTETGVSVIREDGTQVITYHLKTSRPRAGKRLHMIVAEIMKHIHDHQPRALAIERIGANPKSQYTSLMIAELHGALKMELYRFAASAFRPNVYLVAPLTLKKFITQNGRAQKSDIKMAILKKWDAEFGNDNEADAYGLARMAAQAEGFLDTRLSYESECLAKIRESLNTIYGKED